MTTQTTEPESRASEVGERPTWDALVEQHAARVHRLAYRLTGNRADAEDLTQEVFVRVFRSFESFDWSRTSPGSVEAWLHRITTNLFLDSARRRARIRFDPIADGLDAKGSLRAAASDRQVLDSLFDPDVEAALAKLSPELRAAVVLCDVEGLSYEEIARVLGVRMGTVRSRIHRGRAQLRKALAHRAPTEGRERYSGPMETTSPVPSPRAGARS
jgi:RNA polymerase sigma factor (sigma-70 family)